MGALTELGFKRPIYAELLNAQINRAKKLFGDDIDTSELTPLGKFIRITVYDLAQAYEDLEGVYLARFPNSATGVSLDRLCVFAGISRNPPTASIHTVKVTGKEGFEIPSGFLVGTESDVNFYNEDPVTIGEDGTVQYNVKCTELGTIGNVPIGSISKIVNPDANVESVEHIDLYKVGEDKESDTKLRKRFLETIAGGGSATVEAIVASIMRVPNVQGCMLVENDTDFVDEAGRPPRSFECFVYAPKEQYQAVAEAIFDKKPVGIKTYGTLSYQVADEGGYFHTINFSEVIELNIFMKVSVKVDATFENDGAQKIKDNLLYYINSLSNGEDLAYSTLFGYIHDVTGVRSTTSLQLSTDGETYSAGDIICTPDQVVRVKEDNISVEVSSYVDR